LYIHIEDSIFPVVLCNWHVGFILSILSKIKGTGKDIIEIILSFILHDFGLRKLEIFLETLNYFLFSPCAKIKGRIHLSFIYFILITDNDCCDILRSVCCSHFVRHCIGKRELFPLEFDGKIKSLLGFENWLQLRDEQRVTKVRVLKFFHFS
jgi:hypothetical protein